MIQTAITKNLADRGVSGGRGRRHLRGLPAHRRQQRLDRLDQRALRYGPDAAELGTRRRRPITTTKSRNHFEAGTLVIDITDTKTSAAQARLRLPSASQRSPADARAERVKAWWTRSCATCALQVNPTRDQAAHSWRQSRKT
jgi:hypothetical protein